MDKHDPSETNRWDQVPRIVFVSHCECLNYILEGWTGRKASLPGPYHPLSSPPVPFSPSSLLGAARAWHVRTQFSSFSLPPLFFPKFWTPSLLPPPLLPPSAPHPLPSLISHITRDDLASLCIESPQYYIIPQAKAKIASVFTSPTLTPSIWPFVMYREAQHHKRPDSKMLWEGQYNAPCKVQAGKHHKTSTAIIIVSPRPSITTSMPSNHYIWNRMVNRVTGLDFPLKRIFYIHIWNSIE